MPNIRNVLRTQVAGGLAVLALTSFGIAACGGSSGGSSTQTNATARSASSTAASTGKGNSNGTPTSKNGGPHGTSGTNPPRGRFSAMRECLQKRGITIPAPSAGSGRTRGGFLGGPAGGPLPKGVTRTQLQAAMAKCGGGRFGGPGGPGNFRRANSPVFKKALVAYSACLRHNGVNVPTPNTSGKGPVFSTKGLNTSSPQFKSATAKCRGVLFAGFRARGRSPGA